jgi:hypothetical protein
MLRLLNRKRRELLADKKFSDYFWYAFGEIMLVVVGIVIALQIDNWNDIRIEQQQIREYLINLAGDIELDFEMLEPIEKQLSTGLARADDLAVYMQSLAEIKNLDLSIYISMTAYRPYGWNRAALEQIKSSGALRQIRNQQLVKKISQYDALSRHLDEDYQSDVDGIHRVRDFAIQIINTNYPEEFNFDAVEQGEEEFEYLAILKSEPYRQALANDLPLLTADLNQVIAATNYYTEVIKFTGARVRGEIPRLRKFGEEIIELIEAEYPRAQ